MFHADQLSVIIKYSPDTCRYILELQKTLGVYEFLQKS